MFGLGNIIGGLFDFGLGLLGKSADAGISAIQQAKQNEFNAQQAQINRDFQRSERIAVQDWNLQQWNRENEYNTPRAQLDRMLAAGINPNAALNNLSNVSPGSVRSSPQSGATASSVGMFNTDFGSAFQRYNETRLIDAQIKNVDATTDNIGIDNQNKQRVYDDQHNLYTQEVENAKKLSKQYDLDISIKEIELSANQSNLDFILDSFETRLEQLRQDYENSKKQGELLDEQLQTQDLQQQNLRIENSIKQAQAEAERIATEIFETTGIRPTDSTTSVFAKAYELQLKGKEDASRKLLTSYFNYLRQIRDNSTYPTLEGLGVDVLKPLTPKVRNYLDSIMNGTGADNSFWFKPQSKGSSGRRPKYWYTPMGLMPSPY